MMDGFGPPTDGELGAALVDLGHVLAPSGGADFAAAVRRRIVDGSGAASTPVRRRWFHRFPEPAGRPARRALVLALTAVLVAAGLAAAIGYGLPGLRIVFVGPGSTPNPTTTPTASPTATTAASEAGEPSPTPGTSPSSPSPAAIETLGLGDRVSPAQVDARAGYHAILPLRSELGQPIAIFVLTGPGVARVSAAYGATPSIPAAPGAPTSDGRPVAILVVEFPGTTTAGYLEKLLPPGTTIEPLTVAGHDGFWIAGSPHDLFYVGADGAVEPDSTRLVGNVLAWTTGSLTIRIEGAPDLATALEIATSMR